MTLIEALPRVLPIEDAECSDVIAKAYKKRGIAVMAGVKVQKADVTATEVTLHLEVGGKQETVTADKVLMAAGRAVNTEGLGLEKVGVALTDRGFIQVDPATLETSVSSGELLKRADLSLYDAKRSGRNTYRLYHDNLAATAKRTDQLAGVLSGDPTRDYRNTLMLLETIEEIHKRTDFEELLPHVVDTIVDITQAERGILVYMRQEGRGIGLANKLKAYRLQDQGLDTVEANTALGFPADLREYGLGAQMLHYLGARKLRLLTNNPKKIAGLAGYGLELVDQLPLETGANPKNLNYLRTKRDKLGHLLADVDAALGRPDSGE